MTTLLFANNAKTTLAAPISSAALTATLALGTGAMFPSPGAGQAFYLTFTDVLTGNVREIVLVTARSGDTITMVRGQDNTTAQAWLANDVATMDPTAASMANAIQVDQFQRGDYEFATAAGTANALTATIPSNFSTIPNGLNLILMATAANTGTATLTLTLGSTVQSTYPIVKGFNAALVAGDIPGAGYPMQLNWSTVFSAFVLQNPATGIFTAAVPTGSLAWFPCATAPSGYVICNGQLLSRTGYAALYAFAVASGNISASDGTQTNGQFSPGDGSTTFRLPKLGGYFVRNLDSGNGIDPGRAIGTVQAGSNVSHTHAVSDPTHTHSTLVVDPTHYHGAVVYDPGHVHDTELTLSRGYVPGSFYDWPADGGQAAIGGTYGALTGISVGIYSASTGIAVANYAAGTGISVGNTGGYESRPINVAYPCFIKT